MKTNITSSNISNDLNESKTKDSYQHFSLELSNKETELLKYISEAIQEYKNLNQNNKDNIKLEIYCDNLSKHPHTVFFNKGAGNLIKITVSKDEYDILIKRILSVIK